MTGRAPCGVVAREEALWVAVYAAGTVLRIDPASGRITKRIRTGQWPCRVAVDEHALWITRDRAGVVLRIDRRTGRRRSIDLGRSPFDVLLAAGSVWVTSYEAGTIARLDPATGRVVSIARGGDFPAGLTSCKGRIWVGHGRDATWLTSIVPASGEVKRVEVGAQTPGWPTCIGGELWVTTLDSIVRVDSESGAVRARIRLGGTPADAGGGPRRAGLGHRQGALAHRSDRSRHERARRLVSRGAGSLRVRPRRHLDVGDELRRGRYSPLRPLSDAGASCPPRPWSSFGAGIFGRVRGPIGQQSNATKGSSCSREDLSARSRRSL